MKKEERWAFRYEVPTAGGNVSEKVCYPKSKEQVEANRAKARELGYRVVSVKKLYPFNTYANQHNFELINNICHNRMYDMDMGEIEYNEAEYDKLYEIQQKAERFFCLPLPVAWIPWEDWKDAKELSQNAIIHRQNACIEAGRYDLVTYC